MTKKLLKYCEKLELPESFVRLMYINTVMISLFRLFETLYIYFVFGWQENLLISETFGWLYDVFTINTLLILFIPLYIYIKKRSDYWVDTLFLNGMGFFYLLNLPILIYFLYQLELLDFFLWNTSVDESFFTIRTSGISYFSLIIPVVIISVFLTILRRFFKRIYIPAAFSGKTFTLSFLAVAIILQFIYFASFNRFSASKSLHLFAKTAIYALTPKDSGKDYRESDAILFRNLDKTKLYVDTIYPLLHLLDTTDVLGRHFEKFDKSPNIVIIIAEGLSDDFVHPYRGAELMPNLNRIKDHSLYWSQCFSLGERSFSVVPSLLGSLPYGRIGFTIMEKYPRHVTLIPFLKSNNYHTAYFYGQIAWFHQKERFFRFNHIDLIFDKRNYSEKYPKSLVGTENFFWGYEDKSLFDQALEVIDTFPLKPHLNILFTGSMHAPFVISDEKYYDQKLDSIVNKLSAAADKRFYNTYREYFKSILFFDDALGEFIENYQNIPGYENTVFVLTGDHAMSEIPVKNLIKRYHVPLFIFGPKLKERATFDHPVSHLDFYETLLAFLTPYNKNIPDKSPALGSGLFNTSDRYFALMNNNREITDFYDDGYFLSGNQLFKVHDRLEIERSGDKAVRKELKKKRSVFSKTNAYVSLQDKIISDSLFCLSVNHTLITQFNAPESRKFEEAEHYLIRHLDVPSKDLYFQIDFKMKSKRMKLVYQLKDQYDQIRYRQLLDIRPEKKQFQAYVKIPAIKKGKGSYTFDAYILNPGRKKAEYSGLRVFMHAEN